MMDNWNIDADEELRAAASAISSFDAPSRKDPKEIRREKDRLRKRQMSEEQRQKVREQIAMRRSSMSEEAAAKRREKDRERKRLKNSDAEHRQLLNLSARERKAALDKVEPTTAVALFVVITLAVM